MDGICYGLKPSDMLNSSNRKFMDRVADLWDKHVADEMMYMDRQSIILVDTGHWLKQNSWHDDTGFFLKFRLAPLDRGRPMIQEKGRKLVQGFLDLFPGRKNVYYEGQDQLDGGEGVVTVVVQTDSHSIGD